MADLHLQATIPPSNADEKSHKELYVANLQATTPPSNADKKSHQELYVADLVLQATTLNQRQVKRVTKSSMWPTDRPQPPPHQMQMKRVTKSCMCRSTDHNPPIKCR